MNMTFNLSNSQLHRFLLLTCLYNCSFAALESSVSAPLNGDLSAAASSYAGTGSSLYLPLLQANETTSTLNAESIHNNMEPLECGVWLAPSTIPGAGLGLYSGRPFKADEQLQATGDLTLSIIDLRLHNKHNPNFDSFLWDEYTWNAEALNMDHEGYSDVNAASMGFGAAANCFLPILNIDEWNPSHVNPQQLHRSKDPGAGAISAYGNRTTTASRDLLAGEELFVSYGENWFTTRPALGPIPLTDDLDHAHRLVEQYKDLIDRQSLKLLPETLDDIWNMFVRNTSFVDSRVIGAFHHSDHAEMDRLLRQNKTITQLRIEQSTRSIGWLQEHGTCGDHITAQRSTLPQAGMGAFAARNLPQGTRVAAMPLIHISDRTILEMYHFDPESLKQEIPVSHPVFGVRSHQLLLNYCFGHGESSLLLCPYGPISSYINHNQTQANVKIVWADAARGNHMPKLLLHNLTSLDGDATAKLAFDVVATRNILQGEEILLDYGDDWEQAWQTHMQNWKPLPGADRYKPAVELNADKVSRVPTEFDIIDNPSLQQPSVELWCNNLFRDFVWREHKRNGTLQDFIRDGHGKIYRCDNLRAWQDEDDGSWVYSVVLWYESKVDGRPIENIATIPDVPAEAFYWYDLPYSSDIFLPNAFRHAMGIPGELFPSAWRNLKATP
ncbi:hypothetical protein MPSEU_000029400 [Mayamaea pseudoterrestris]|nr:hypothetical protein MPSEU_000029400 [Mayamaea pseudoterrestris]